MPFWPWSKKSSATVVPQKQWPNFDPLIQEGENTPLPMNNSIDTEACKKEQDKLNYLEQNFIELQDEWNKAKLFKKKRNTNHVIRSIERRIEINRILYKFYTSQERQHCFKSEEETELPNYLELGNNVSHAQVELETRFDKERMNQAEKEVEILMRKGGRRTRKGRKAKRSQSRRRT